MAKKSAEYVDGFVLAVPKKNIEAYREMAERSARVLMEHGALEVRECIARIFTGIRVGFCSCKTSK